MKYSYTPRQNIAAANGNLFRISAIVLLFGAHPAIAQDHPPSLPEPRAPVVRTVQTETQTPTARTFAFSAERQPDKFLDAFERRFGDAAGESGSRWERITYQPWGVGDVTVSMHIARREEAGAGPPFEVSLHVELPEGVEDYDAAMEEIRIWFQRLVNATLGGEE